MILNLAVFCRLQGFFLKILNELLKNIKGFQKKTGIIINGYSKFLNIKNKEMHIYIHKMHIYPKLTES